MSWGDPIWAAGRVSVPEPRKRDGHACRVGPREVPQMIEHLITEGLPQPQLTRGMGLPLITVLS